MNAIFKILFPEKQELIDSLRKEVGELREKNKGLRSDLIELSVNPDSLESSFIRHTHCFYKGMEDVVWSGTREMTE